MKPVLTPEQIGALLPPAHSRIIVLDTETTGIRQYSLPATHG